MHLACHEYPPDGTLGESKPQEVCFCFMRDGKLALVASCVGAQGGHAFKCSPDELLALGEPIEHLRSWLAHRNF